MKNLTLGTGVEAEAQRWAETALITQLLRAGAGARAPLPCAKWETRQRSSGQTAEGSLSLQRCQTIESWPDSYLLNLDQRTVFC